MTITGSEPHQQIVTDLEFIKPFKASNRATFQLIPTNGGTKISWTMEGQNGFMGKANSVFLNMDKLVEKDFEEGLQNLNKEAKAQAAKT